MPPVPAPPVADDDTLDTHMGMTPPNTVDTVQWQHSSRQAATTAEMAEASASRAVSPLLQLQPRDSHRGTPSIPEPSPQSPENDPNVHVVRICVCVCMHAKEGKNSASHHPHLSSTCDDTDCQDGVQGATNHIHLEGPLPVHFPLVQPHSPVLHQVRLWVAAAKNKRGRGRKKRERECVCVCERVCVCVCACVKEGRGRSERRKKGGRVNGAPTRSDASFPNEDNVEACMCRQFSPALWGSLC